MTLGDVGHLVPQHTGEFVLAIDQREQSARDVKSTARNREGVRLRLIDNLKTELPSRIVHFLRQPLSDIPHERLSRRGGTQTDLLLNNLCHLGALLDVAVGRRREQLAVRSGRDCPERKDGKGKMREPRLATNLRLLELTTQRFYLLTLFG